MEVHSAHPSGLPADSARVCVIQHIRCETPGLITEMLQTEGIGMQAVQTFRNQTVPPDLKPYDGLVIMGGPMSVYEQNRYAHLRKEIRLIEQALAEEKPVLGICLGSQLLAAALDARVGPGKRKEIGWFPMTLSRDAAGDRLWADAPGAFMAYSWHGDVFDLPQHSVSLASSELTECQAFRYGRKAYGILFHMEVTEKAIREMVSTFSDELEMAKVDGGEILAQAADHLPALQEIGRSVFRRWARMTKTEVTDEQVPRSR